MESGQGIETVSLAGKKIILGVTGGIAAYKAAELCRLLVKAGAGVQVAMTAAAQQFVTPLTFQALSGRPVLTSLWDTASGDGMDHIHLSRDADLILVAPASADFLAEKLSLNLPDDRDYATAAGFALAAFKRLPGEGESVTEQGWTFEVVDLDGRRIDKLLVTRARAG